MTSLHGNRTGRDAVIMIQVIGRCGTCSAVIIASDTVSDCSAERTCSAQRRDHRSHPLVYGGPSLEGLLFP